MHCIIDFAGVIKILKIKINVINNRKVNNAILPLIFLLEII